MKRKSKLLLSTISILTISSILVLTNFTNSYFLTNLFNNKNSKIEEDKVDSRNRYLINLKTAPNIRYTESPSNLDYLIKQNILSLDNKYVKAFDIDGDGPGKEMENRIEINISELNKYNVGEKEFIESLKFDLKGGFYKSLDEKQKIILTKYFNFDEYNPDVRPNTPFSFKFPDDYKPDSTKPIHTFTSQKFKIEDYAPGNKKYIKLLINASYNSNTKMLYITPQFEALNNTIPESPLSFEMAANQDIFLSITSPFIWEDNGVVLDEYISSEFRMIGPGQVEKITINPHPPTAQEAVSEISFANSGDNPTGGILANKAGDDKDIVIDLSNIYYDDALAKTKTFDIILNNFKVEELSHGGIPFNNSKDFYPINFKLVVDETEPPTSQVILSHSFMPPYLDADSQGFIKMELVLEKVSNLIYKLSNIQFTSAAGTESIAQNLIFPLPNSEFISLIVKPSDFSALNGLEDINQTNENKSPTTISSTYSSDVFDDSNIDVNNAGQNIESNFSKVKKDLH